MKRTLIILSALAFMSFQPSSEDCSKRITQMEVELNSCKEKIDDLQKRLDAMEQRERSRNTSSSGVSNNTEVSPPVNNGTYITRCQATTQKGTQCKRSAQAGGKYCWQHQR